MKINQILPWLPEQFLRMHQMNPKYSLSLELSNRDTAQGV